MPQRLCTNCSAYFNLERKPDRILKDSEGRTTYLPYFNQTTILCLAFDDNALAPALFPCVAEILEQITEHPAPHSAELSVEFTCLPRDKVQKPESSGQVLGHVLVMCLYHK